MNNIQKLYLFSFLKGLTFFGALSVPFFLDWGKLNYTQIFTLQAWFMFWIFLLEVPTGTIADKYGRKVSLMLGGFMLSAATFIYSQIPDFYVFLFAEFLFAISLTLFSGADQALLYDSLRDMKKHKESKHFFSRYEMFHTIGLVIAFPVGTLIAGSKILPYPEILALPMLLTSIPALCSAFLALSMKEPKRTKSEENLFKIGIKGIHYFRKHKALRSFAIDTALISAMTFFIFWLYQPLLLNSGMDLALIGFVAAGYNLLAVIMLSQLKLIEKRISAQRLLFLTAFVPSAALIGLAVYKELWFVLLGVFIVASLRLFRRPLFDSYMNKFIKSNDRATVLSAISMFQRVVIMIFYPIIGIISDVNIYYALAVLGLLALIFSFFAKVNRSYL